MRQLARTARACGLPPSSCLTPTPVPDSGSPLHHAGPGLRAQPHPRRAPPSPRASLHTCCRPGARAGQTDMHEVVSSGGGRGPALPWPAPASQTTHLACGSDVRPHRRRLVPSRPCHTCVGFLPGIRAAGGHGAPLPSVGAQAGCVSAPQVCPRVPASRLARTCEPASAHGAAESLHTGPATWSSHLGRGCWEQERGSRPAAPALPPRRLAEQQQARGWHPHLCCTHLGGPVGMRPGQHMGCCPGQFGRLGAPSSPAGLACVRGAVQHGSAEVCGSHVSPSPRGWTDPWEGLGS